VVPGDQLVPGRGDLARKQLQRRLLRVRTATRITTSRTSGRAVRAARTAGSVPITSMWVRLKSPSPSCAKSSRVRVRMASPVRCALATPSMPTIVSCASQRKPTIQVALTL
jgi:hypothetical protein